ncbi:MAG: hypothetical protein KJ820_02215, partial [Bacteroidetes bacterium]|nr:hypothetical protein [Bacteroidota bacterium]
MFKLSSKPRFLSNQKIIGFNRLYFKFFLAVLILVYNSSSAQVCGTSGLDGPQNAVAPVNTYFPLSTTATLTSGSKTIVLNGVPPNDPNYNLSYGVTPIKSGDLILIIQMQDASFDYTNSSLYGAGTATSGPDNLGGTGYTDVGNSGKFEYVVATSNVPLTGGVLTFRGAGAGQGCVNTYTNADATATRGQRRFQVVRVPQYSNLVLTANITTPPYNGSVGGLIAFDVAGTMQFNGFIIDASERGFRGGYGPVAASNANNSTFYTGPSSDTRSVGKGEGIAGTPRYMWDGFNQVDNGSDGLPGGSYGRGAPANAGGGGNDHNSGGGGGANGGYGGLGGMGWQGANGDVSPLTGGGRPGMFLPVDYSRLIMGGGGGGGDANNATSGVKGGVGGGIILINVEKITGIGVIKSNGGAGQAGAFGSAPDGAGGGGAGGSIFLRSLAASPTANLTLEAKGGSGGNTLNDNNNEHGPGGGGGGGLIYTQIPSATITNLVTKGNSGKTNDGVGIPHGALDGTDGQTGTFTTTDLPSHLQGGGSICYPTLTTTLTEQNAGPAGARNAGTTATYTLTIGNSLSNGNAGNVEAWLNLPSSFKVGSISYSLTGDAAGTLNATPLIGTSGIMNFGNFNISPGDKVIITIVVNIASNAPSGVYSASAQATYLDPTRTNINPNRKITGMTDAFPGYNTSYETGGITSVGGANYNGDLSTSTAEDVYLNSITVYNPCNNAVTGGGFDNYPTNDYPTGIGPWTPINSGEIVKIVDEGSLRGVAIKKGLYSLKQQIQSIKASTSYTFFLNMRRWTSSSGCNPNANASFRVRVYDSSNPSVYLLDFSQTTNNNTPIVISQSFNTNASTSSLVLLIEETSSGTPACPLFLDDISISSAISISNSSTNLTCKGANNGKIKVDELSGAAAPYQISYSSDGGNSYSAPISSGTISAFGTPLSFTNLPAGNYILKIVDANQCLNTRNITITEPTAITLSSSTTAISCNGGTSTASLTASGGAGTYQYSKDGTTFQTSNIFANLTAGAYTFTLKDANGCTKTANATITEPTALSLTESHTNILCNSGTT